MELRGSRPTVLVTGGAGYIGSHVCKALAENGYLPITFDSLVEGHGWAVRWGPLVTGDILQPELLTNVFLQCRPTAVIHLAGLIAAGESVTDPAKYYRNNVVGTLNLLTTMRAAGIDKIVFSSSAAVYGEPVATPIPERHPTSPINPYGMTKLACEGLLRDFAAAHAVRSVSLRYFNAAGADLSGEIGEAHRNETHLIPIVLDVAAGLRAHISVYGDDYPTEDGTCVRDYVHVSDLALAHVLALEYLSENTGALRINLGSGSGFTVRQVIDCAANVSGARIPIVYHPRRDGDPAVLLADISLALRTLQWRPIHSDLSTSIATAWNWHRRLENEGRRNTLAPRRA